MFLICNALAFFCVSVTYPTKDIGDYMVKIGSVILTVTNLVAFAKTVV